MATSTEKPHFYYTADPSKCQICKGSIHEIKLTLLCETITYFIIYHNVYNARHTTLYKERKIIFQTCYIGAYWPVYCMQFFHVPGLDSLLSSKLRLASRQWSYSGHEISEIILVSISDVGKKINAQTHIWKFEILFPLSLSVQIQTSNFYPFLPM